MKFKRKTETHTIEWKLVNFCWWGSKANPHDFFVEWFRCFNAKNTKCLLMFSAIFLLFRNFMTNTPLVTLYLWIHYGIIYHFHFYDILCNIQIQRIQSKFIILRMNPFLRNSGQLSASITSKQQTFRRKFVSKLKLKFHSCLIHIKSNAWHS